MNKVSNKGMDTDIYLNHSYKFLNGMNQIDSDNLKEELQSTIQLLESLLPVFQQYQQHYELPKGLTELVQKQASSLTKWVSKLS